LNLSISTTTFAPNTTGGNTLLTTTFATNIGADNTVVFSGSGSLVSPGCAGPATCPFDMVVTFTTPFRYHPSSGNLLLDFQITGITSSTGFLDAEQYSAPGQFLASMAAPLGNPTSPGVALAGNIAQFGVTLVPEPATSALMLVGLGTLVAMRRRRLQK
jgi:hypothetical protein